MIDWTMLSPTFLAAVVEWAGAVAMKKIPSHLSLPLVRRPAAECPATDVRL
jgi:hypothetical protein